MQNPLGINAVRRAACGLLAVALVLLADTALACPSCKEALADGGGDVVAGYFWSILFMLSMPLLILGGLGSYFYALVRKARAAEPNAPGDPAGAAQPSGHSAPLRGHHPVGA